MAPGSTHPRSGGNHAMPEASAIDARPPPVFRSTRAAPHLEGTGCSWTQNGPDAGCSPMRSSIISAEDAGTVASDRPESARPSEETSTVNATYAASGSGGNATSCALHARATCTLPKGSSPTSLTLVASRSAPERSSAPRVSSSIVPAMRTSEHPADNKAVRELRKWQASAGSQAELKGLAPICSMAADSMVAVAAARSPAFGGALPLEPKAMIPTRARSYTRTVARLCEANNGTCAGRSSVPGARSGSAWPGSEPGRRKGSANTRPAIVDSFTSIVGSGPSRRFAISNCTASSRPREATQGRGEATGNGSEACMVEMDDGWTSSYIETELIGPKDQCARISRSTEAPAALHPR